MSHDLVVRSLFCIAVNRRSLSCTKHRPAFGFHCVHCPLQCAFQGVVVVLEVLELQEMLGPLAALSWGGQVCDLNGGPRGRPRRVGQIFSCWLVLLVQAAGAGVDLYTGIRRKWREGERERKLSIWTTPPAGQGWNFSTYIHRWSVKWHLSCVNTPQQSVNRLKLFLCI